MKVEVKKLYKGKASVRDYIVSKCYRKGEDLQISYNGKSIIIKNSMIPFYERQTKKKMISKFDGKEYFLCDFDFEVKYDSEVRALQSKDGSSSASPVFTNKDEQKTLF